MAHSLDEEDVNFSCNGCGVDFETFDDLRDHTCGLITDDEEEDGAAPMPMTDGGRTREATLRRACERVDRENDWFEAEFVSALNLPHGGRAGYLVLHGGNSSKGESVPVAFPDDRALEEAVDRLTQLSDRDWQVVDDE